MEQYTLISRLKYPTPILKFHRGDKFAMWYKASKGETGSKEHYEGRGPSISRIRIHALGS